METSRDDSRVIALGFLLGFREALHEYEAQRDKEEHRCGKKRFHPKGSTSGLHGILSVHFVWSQSATSIFAMLV